MDSLPPGLINLKDWTTAELKVQLATQTALLKEAEELLNKHLPSEEWDKYFTATEGT